MKKTYIALCVGFLVVIAIGVVGAQTLTQPPPTSFSGVTCTNCTMLSSVANAMPLKGEQGVRVQTNSSGLYAWTYPVAFSAIPVCQVTSESASSGSTDVVNAQFDGPPSATVANIKVTRSAAVTVLSVSVLGVATTQVTYVDILCREQ